MEYEIKNNVQQDNVDKATTIKLSREVRDKLAEIGNKDETFDDVIRRLIRRAEPERSAEIMTGKSSLTHYERRKEFVEIPLKDDKGNKENIGIEYDYNIPPKKSGEWELDIKIVKVYCKQKSYNPSEYFGVDNDHKHFSQSFIEIYFIILGNILGNEFGIIKAEFIKFFSARGLGILDWKKIYYENKLSEESFIDDVEEVLRKFSDKKEDAKIKDQLKNSIVGY